MKSSRRRGDQKVLDKNSQNILAALDTTLDFCSSEPRRAKCEQVMRNVASLDSRVASTAKVVLEAERLAVKLQAVQAVLVHEAKKARTLEGEVTGLTARLCGLSDEVASKAVDP